MLLCINTHLNVASQFQSNFKSNYRRAIIAMVHEVILGNINMFFQAKNTIKNAFEQKICFRFLYQNPKFAIDQRICLDSFQEEKMFAARIKNGVHATNVFHVGNAHGVAAKTIYSFL